MSTKNIILVLVVIAIGGTIWYLESGKAGRHSDAEVVSVAPRTPVLPENSTNDDTAPDSGVSGPVAATSPVATKAPAPDKSKKYPLAKEITTLDAFINTGVDAAGKPKPITISELVGKKVILVDFWTYSCINCQRTQPYLNAWYEKYKDKGLEIVGVHTPEFDFEKNLDNVKAAVVKEGIKYPVVLDNDFSTWTAYQNRFWPRKYLIDIDGYIVYDRIGEGGYDETEQEIQKLLAERADVLNISNAGIPQGVVKPAEDLQAVNGGTLETYFGSARNQTLGNGTRGVTGTQTFTKPTAGNVAQHVLYLGGTWNVQPEYAESASAGATITLSYKAQNVFFVAKAAGNSGANGVTIKITRDGKALGAEAGEDVKMVGGESTALIKEARLYKLIEDKAVGEHTIEITIPAGALEAFTFTFG